MFQTKRIILNISSFRGISPGAIHYYGHLWSCDKRIKDREICRNVTVEELKTQAFEGYFPNSKTDRYESLLDLLKDVVLLFKKYYLKGGWYLDIEKLSKYNDDIEYWKKFFKGIPISYIPENWDII